VHQINHRNSQEALVGTSDPADGRYRSIHP